MEDHHKLSVLVEKMRHELRIAENRMALGSQNSNFWLGRYQALKDALQFIDLLDLKVGNKDRQCTLCYKESCYECFVKE